MAVAVYEMFRDARRGVVQGGDPDVADVIGDMARDGPATKFGRRWSVRRNRGMAPIARRNVSWVRSSALPTSDRWATNRHVLLGKRYKHRRSPWPTRRVR